MVAASAVIGVVFGGCSTVRDRTKRMTRTTTVKSINVRSCLFDAITTGDTLSCFLSWCFENDFHDEKALRVQKAREGPFLEVVVRLAGGHYEAIELNRKTLSRGLPNNLLCLRVVSPRVGLVAASQSNFACRCDCEAHVPDNTQMPWTRFRLVYCMSNCSPFLERMNA